MSPIGDSPCLYNSIVDTKRGGFVFRNHLTVATTMCRHEFGVLTTVANTDVSLRRSLFVTVTVNPGVWPRPAITRVDIGAQQVSPGGAALQCALAAARESAKLRL